MTLHKIDIHRQDPSVRMPFRATPDSACFDIHAHLKTGQGNAKTFNLPPHTVRPVPTGLRVRSNLPLLVCSRSGLAKNGIITANAPGIIDPDYRGEIFVLLLNTTSFNHYIQDGDRIAQLLVVDWIKTTLVEVDSIPLDTERGEAGFGSTGR